MKNSQPDPPEGSARMRMLVAIASYGEKNLTFLRKLIAGYRAMALDVDVVVLSEAPKDLGPGVEVLVGLPSKNPWSLPFAHKLLFAQRLDHYDLFAYSEDDMEVTEANIRAFLEITPLLEPDEIAGFLRYELDPSGALSLPEVHGAFRWKPESVKKRGTHTVAEFTNEHAAFYLLTQAQLRSAVASGGFLTEPYEGRHDMLCAAATDPYTRCGFRKVLCISALDSFLIHHLPNRYAGQLGLPLPAVREQVETLCRIRDGLHPATTLCAVESKSPRGKWSKNCYELPDERLLQSIPGIARSVLSVGCGWGATEARLVHRGLAVTALPVDSVIGAAAARRGIKVIYESLEAGIKQLNGQTFDCVVISELVHLLPDPRVILSSCAGLVSPGGALAIQGPNFDSLLVLAKRLLGSDGYASLRDFSKSGVNGCGWRSVSATLNRLGFRVASKRFYNRNRQIRFCQIRERLGRLGADTWCLQACRALKTD